MVSILVPLGYISFLFISLLVFSKIHRKRALRRTPTPPWFPHHKQRDLYISLLSLEPAPPRPILIAALMNRAMEDVRRIWAIRDAKPALQTLVTKGQVGDGLWEAFQEAEKELEKEIVEVVGEADYFEKGYGQKIFNVASDMITHDKWKGYFNDIPEKRKAEELKMASKTVLTPLLHPTSYLTPSSLTLSPSNPLSPTAPPPAPAVAPATAPLTSSRPTPVPSPQPPVASTSANFAPPTPPQTPPPAVPIASTSKSTPSTTPQKTLRPEIAQRLQALREKSAAAAASVNGSPDGAEKKSTTPKGKKKKPVKGGK